MATIEFRNVSFGRSDGPQVLNGFSISVESGETVARFDADPALYSTPKPTMQPIK